MLSCCYEVIFRLFDHYLPQRLVEIHSNDKPWVTDSFRRLIICRQRAWCNNMVQCRRYRNSVQRTAVTLKNRFYDHCVAGLRSHDSRNWWRHVKRLNGQTKSDHLDSLASELYGISRQLLADNISQSLFTVFADLGHLEPIFPQVALAISHQNILLSLTLLSVNWVVSKFTSLTILIICLTGFYVTFLFGAEPVCAIYNIWLQPGIFPSFWKQSNVFFPVPIKNPPKSTDGVIRPILLTSTLT